MCPVCPPAFGLRAGPKPRTTPTNPHTQLEQNAPRHLQERLFARACELADVVPSKPIANTCASPPIEVGSVMLATVLPAVSGASMPNR